MLRSEALKLYTGYINYEKTKMVFFVYGYIVYEAMRDRIKYFVMLVYG